jgi:hypothetical protein
VLLTFKGAVLTIGKDVSEHPRRLAYEWEACPTGDNECRYRDCRRPLDRQRVVAHDCGVVGKRVRQGLLGLPERLGSRVGNELGWKAHHLRHEILDSIASPTSRDHLVVALHQVCRRSATLVENERRLPQRQLPDGEPARRGLEGQGRTGRGAVDERRLTGNVDYGTYVFDLALDGVRRCVSTGASARRS